jgi:hypothetical protein
MVLRGKFTGDRLEIEQTRVGDGKVSASGYVSLAADSGYPGCAGRTGLMPDWPAARHWATATALAFTKSAKIRARTNSGRLNPVRSRHQGAAEIPS